MQTKYFLCWTALLYYKALMSPKSTANIGWPFFAKTISTESFSLRRNEKHSFISYHVITAAWIQHETYFARYSICASFTICRKTHDVVLYLIIISFKQGIRAFLLEGSSFTAIVTFSVKLNRTSCPMRFLLMSCECCWNRLFALFLTICSLWLLCQQSLLIEVQR